MGVANVADMPAAAPATSSVVRSASERCNHCATRDPKAPPVMMIGPSAPNGPPEPMAIAAEIRFEHSDLRLDTRAAQEDGFDGFGNSVPANFVSAVAGHQALRECLQ